MGRVAQQVNRMLTALELEYLIVLISVEGVNRRVIQIARLG